MHRILKIELPTKQIKKFYTAILKMDVYCVDVLSGCNGVRSVDVRMWYKDSLISA